MAMLVCGAFVKSVEVSCLLAVSHCLDELKLRSILDKYALGYLLICLRSRGPQQLLIVKIGR